MNEQLTSFKAKESLLNANIEKAKKEKTALEFKLQVLEKAKAKAQSPTTSAPVVVAPVAATPVVSPSLLAPNQPVAQHIASPTQSPQVKEDVVMTEAPLPSRLHRHR